MLRRPSFLGRTAIAGVGYCSLSRRSDRSVLALAVDATREATADAGLQLADIDGIVSYSWLGDSVTTHAVATWLGLPSAHCLLDTSLGGQAPCFLIANAAPFRLATGSGYASAGMSCTARTRSGTAHEGVRAAIEIKIPQLGVAMAEGEITASLVENGATVKGGDLLYTVATGKTETDIESARYGYRGNHRRGGWNLAGRYRSCPVDMTAASSHPMTVARAYSGVRPHRAAPRGPAPHPAAPDQRKGCSRGRG
jgi:Biotin-requiring enzyme